MLHEAAQEPCSACPWRTANHGKPHPHGWYTKANLRRLWAGVRKGERMSCHPTDPDNLVPDGVKPPPDDAMTKECAGALILQQREVDRFQKLCAQADRAGRTDGLPRYRKAHPKGMTREGVVIVVERALFGGTSFGGPSMSTPDLNLPVSHVDLQSWEPR